MKKMKIALLLSTALLAMNASYAQSVRIGNATNGVTASGNTLSLANGSGSLQLNNLPPLIQGGINAAKDVAATAPTVDTSKISVDNLAKLEAAKVNFLKQKEDADKLAAQNVVVAAKPVVQDQVSIGQDLNTLKANLVTKDIGFYNTSTLNEFEEKASVADPKMYSKFPEYVIKNY